MKNLNINRLIQTISFIVILIATAMAMLSCDSKSYQRQTLLDKSLINGQPMAYEKTHALNAPLYIDAQLSDDSTLLIINYASSDDNAINYNRYIYLYDRCLNLYRLKQVYNDSTYFHNSERVVIDNKCRSYNWN